MAELRPVEPVVRICAIFSRYADARHWAIERLTERWGAVEQVTTELPFEAGGFYQRSMGSELSKVWVSFRYTVPPENLADWKRETNDLEQQYGQRFEGPESRPLNLDPGYVTQAKLVLATTKDRDHRIYLRDGIFAEVTLSFTGGCWVDHRWTYPDYRSETVRSFVSDCREQLRQHLRQAGGRRQA